VKVEHPSSLALPLLQQGRTGALADLTRGWRARCGRTNAPRKRPALAVEQERKLDLGLPPRRVSRWEVGRVGWVRGSRKQLEMTSLVDAMAIDGKLLDVAAALYLMVSRLGEVCKMWNTGGDSRRGLNVAGRSRHEGTLEGLGRMLNSASARESENVRPRCSLAWVLYSRRPGLRFPRVVFYRRRCHCSEMFLLPMWRCGVCVCVSWEEGRD